MTDIPWPRVADTIQSDVMARGILRSRLVRESAGAKALETASRELAERARKVGIVTGFPILVKGRPIPETDGPLGALFLAFVLTQLGIEISILVDRFCLPLIQGALPEIGLPLDAGIAIDGLLTENSYGEFTHLVAIERPGPSHSLRSGTVVRDDEKSGAAPLSRLAPAAHRGRCHNMRGRIIDRWIAPAHRLFESGDKQRELPFSIGIGDGGNEIGFGRIPWTEIHQVIPDGLGARIACRVATDVLIVAGISNWAAYALAIGTAAVRGHSDFGWDARRHGELLDLVTRKLGAVDGVTARAEPTVDGMPKDAYLRVFSGLRRISGRTEC